MGEIRLSRVFVDDFPGSKIEGAGAQGSERFGNNYGRRDAVLPGYIHLPSRGRDDAEFWAGKWHRSPLVCGQSNTNILYISL